MKAGLLFFEKLAQPRNDPFEINGKLAVPELAEVEYYRKQWDTGVGGASEQ